MTGYLTADGTAVGRMLIFRREPFAEDVGQAFGSTRKALPSLPSLAIMVMGVTNKGYERGIGWGYTGGTQGGGGGGGSRLVPRPVPRIRWRSAKARGQGTRLLLDRSLLVSLPLSSQ